jgi:hypothetical protein
LSDLTQTATTNAEVIPAHTEKEYGEVEAKLYSL